jgi:hypothetical protein
LNKKTAEANTRAPDERKLFTSTDFYVRKKSRSGIIRPQNVRMTAIHQTNRGITTKIKNYLNFY